MKRDRVKQSKVEHAFGWCRECEWSTTATVAVSQAARHHDDTGHEVDAEQTIRVRYGKSRLERLAAR